MFIVMFIVMLTSLKVIKYLLDLDGNQKLDAYIKKRFVFFGHVNKSITI